MVRKWDLPRNQPSPFQDDVYPFMCGCQSSFNGISFWDTCFMESCFTSTKILAINLHHMEICVRTGDFELLAFPIKTVMLSEVTRGNV